MSHYYLMKYLHHKYTGSASAYVVFEDDARCITGWREQVDKTLSFLPDDWDLLFIGGRPISYFHEFNRVSSFGAQFSLRHDICTGVFGKASGPLAPDGSRNISRSDPYWRAMYLVHTHAYVLNPVRMQRVLGVLEGKEGHEPIDQRLATAMANSRLVAYMTPENICEQSNLMLTYTPDWNGKTPQPWMGHFGFPEEALRQHPSISESHMWGKIILDQDDSEECRGKY